MNKEIRTIFCTAAFAVLAVSCQKEIEDIEPVAGARETIEISVGGLMGEYTQVDATKSSLVNTVRVAWEADDIVYVYDETQCLGSLAASLDKSGDNRYAILSGTIGTPDGNKLFLVHSPMLSGAPAINEGTLSISLAEQATEKAPFVVFATLDYTDGNITDAIVPFTFATSVIRVNCTGLQPGTAISKAEIYNVNTNCVLTFADGAVTASGTDEGLITRLNADGFEKVNAEGDACFQVAVPAMSASTGRTLTINQGGYEYEDANFSKSSIATNLSVNTICTMAGKSTITPESPVGTVGLIDGRKAMVVNLYGGKYAVALRNEGATADSGTDSYGSYYTFEEAEAFFHDSDLNKWRVPSMDEMKALTDMPREYDGTTPALTFKTAGSFISFPLAGLGTSEGVSEIGHAFYYTSTPLEGAEGDMVCFMDYRDEAPCVEYVANPAPDLYKLSLRLFYQLTETNKDIVHGTFTVNENGKQVYFSKGNLWADGNNALHFESDQYGYNSNYESSHVSHFTWSSTVSAAVGENNSGDNLFCDENNKVSVDGSDAIYYALSTAEWQYLLYNHDKKKASVNGVNGYVIAPDNFSGTLLESYTDDAALAADNLVFLPAAGFRDDTNVNEVGEFGCYWSSSAYESNQAYYVFFNGEENLHYDRYGTRHSGNSVRLVTDCE